MIKTYLIPFLFCCASLFSQEVKETSFFVDANYFYGSIVRHNKDISHLVKGHPEGVIISYNRETFGQERWEQVYNYPDYGFSFVYQDTESEILGDNFGLYGHYNFYFLKRNLFLRIGQGIAYNTNPFDKEKNPKNNAYGSSFLSSTYVMLNYNKQHIFEGFGIQAGLSIVHYSNANVKAPNSSTNAITFNLGLQYEIDSEEPSEYIEKKKYESYTEPIALNIVLRGGFNESDYIGLGQQPFGVISAYADKRIGFKSSIQLGADAFFAKFLKKEVEFLATAYPTRGLTGDEDYKRVGVFAGHELHINKISLVSQFGYYVYYPYEFEGRTYIRAGLNYNFTEQLFGAVTLKSHGAKAEGIEFGIGIRI
ncbi:acyloxyacyl hydrolase [Ulvibacter antarcticus]|nr:acyloxyacyl hydrolase [Ulvibacter antarcticus]